MKIQVWRDPEGVLRILGLDDMHEWYYPYRERCFWLTGLTLYKMLQEGWTPR